MHILGPLIQATSVQHEPAIDSTWWEHETAAAILPADFIPFSSWLTSSLRLCPPWTQTLAQLLDLVLSLHFQFSLPRAPPLPLPLDLSHTPACLCPVSPYLFHGLYVSPQKLALSFSHREGLSLGPWQLNPSHRTTLLTDSSLTETAREVPCPL